jgi:hypothetical protein
VYACMIRVSKDIQPTSRSMGLIDELIFIVDYQKNLKRICLEKNSLLF